MLNDFNSTQHLNGEWASHSMKISVNTAHNLCLLLILGLGGGLFSKYLFPLLRPSNPIFLSGAIKVLLYFLPLYNLLVQVWLLTTWGLGGPAGDYKCGTSCAKSFHNFTCLLSDLSCKCWDVSPYSSSASQTYHSHGGLLSVTMLCCDGIIGCSPGCPHLESLAISCDPIWRHLGYPVGDHWGHPTIMYGGQRPWAWHSWGGWRVAMRWLTSQRG